MLSEGVTAFFTDCVLQDEGFGNFNDAYRDQKKKAEKLMKGLSGNQFDVTASFNFNYQLFKKMANAFGIYNQTGLLPLVPVAQPVDAVGVEFG